MRSVYYFVIFHALCFGLSTAAFAESSQTNLHTQQHPLLASPIKNGFTWTLTSRLGQSLKLAEEKYGKRDPKWTILGVEFAKRKQPAIWYPFSQEGKHYIIVQLTPDSLDNHKQALFQLAHETIHLLSPAGGGHPTNVFEEGLAVYFSVLFLQQEGIDIKTDYITGANYRQAYELVKELYRAYPQTDKIIQQIREEKGKLSGLSVADLQHYFPNLDEDSAILLITPF
ncbi:MAG TPA: hypothetical protein ENK78_00785 [Thiothrix sp.]|nr:hypothetical protein [Thiothrix sp.]